MEMIRSYAALTGASDPGDVDAREARNGWTHVAALSLTKIADGLIDPKLVLAWALNAAGTPTVFTGLLVPVREAGALLPQLALAPRVEAALTRRWFWTAGSAVQGLCAGGIALAVATLEGAQAGWAVVLLLACLATARAVCSVSYKDALARSLPKTRRGAVTGLAGSVASGTVLLFGALLATGLLPLSIPTIAAAIGIAAACWLAGAAVLARLDERAKDPDLSGGTPLGRLVDPILTDAQLRRLVAARALLTATALAPPFLLLASARGDAGGLGQLGPLVLASAMASILSSYVWGRLSDRSSRMTLASSAGLGAAILGGAASFAHVTGGLGGVTGAVLFIFVAQIAYQGVRAGRSLHLTDMATDDQRARFTALSNSLIGLVLLAGGTLGFLADATGPAAVLGLLSVACLAALPVALSLDDVQRDQG